LYLKILPSPAEPVVLFRLSINKKIRITAVNDFAAVILILILKRFYVYFKLYYLIQFLKLLLTVTFT
jgi:hypothetical protein